MIKEGEYTLVIGITLEIKMKRARRPFFQFRQFAIFTGRSGGLIAEITWKVGKLEVICECYNRTKSEKLLS